MLCGHIEVGVIITINNNKISSSYHNNKVISREEHDNFGESFHFYVFTSSRSGTGNRRETWKKAMKPKRFMQERTGSTTGESTHRKLDTDRSKRIWIWRRLLPQRRGTQQASQGLR